MPGRCSTRFRSRSCVTEGKENPSPTRDEIRDGLQGNICRCTGYDKIVDAVQAAALELDGKAGSKK